MVIYNLSIICNWHTQLCENLSCNYIATYDAYKLFSKATCEHPKPTHSGVATLGHWPHHQDLSLSCDSTHIVLPTYSNY